MTRPDARSPRLRPWMGSCAPQLGTGTNRAAAEQVGKLIAERARSAGVEAVVFDRGAYRYHGRIKALADAARAGGLVF